ncbi:hypothetical protein HYPSUDRAFT_207989 [Hypholoma sublateritium FD-334 SS-4]|uniref:Uncharacterized protein n=1 Tax=Hypholoma sublateritium (strain FD-334 SS-4) TaxID=945553 RepID=A0A0D2LWU3_HYPSF|nr:hypothetical protein HYPSUDRAFT_207989 [Hypholoma sublateritium FD-334 SS-4]
MRTYFKICFYRRASRAPHKAYSAVTVRRHGEFSIRRYLPSALCQPASRRFLLPLTIDSRRPHPKFHPTSAPGRLSISPFYVGSVTRPRRAHLAHGGTLIADTARRKATSGAYTRASPSSGPTVTPHFCACVACAWIPALHRRPSFSAAHSVSPHALPHSSVPHPQLPAARSHADLPPSGPAHACTLSVARAVSGVCRINAVGAPPRTLLVLSGPVRWVCTPSSLLPPQYCMSRQPCRYRGPTSPPTFLRNPCLYMPRRCFPPPLVPGWPHQQIHEMLV